MTDPKLDEIVEAIRAALTEAYDLGRAERDKELTAALVDYPSAQACLRLVIAARESAPAEPKEEA